MAHTMAACDVASVFSIRGTHFRSEKRLSVRCGLRTAEPSAEARPMPQCSQRIYVAICDKKGASERWQPGRDPSFLHSAVHDVFTQLSKLLQKGRSARGFVSRAMVQPQKANCTSSKTCTAFANRRPSVGGPHFRRGHIMPEQRTSRAAESELTPEQQEEKRFREAFNVFDADGSGALSVAELRAVLTRPGGGTPLSDAEVEAIIAEFDTNGDGVMLRHHPT